MPLKRLRLRVSFGLAVLALSASAAFAQKTSTAQITVSKNKDDNAMYETVQAAVNAARRGYVIEILDTATYNEQVTIDGRGEDTEKSIWDGHNGVMSGTSQSYTGPVLRGKNGITIKYVPPPGTPINSGFARPTIKWQDKENQSPKTYAESQVETDGELKGGAGNFQNCGALRIIQAEGVTIEGIAVDGGGAAPFGWTGIWGNKDPLVHGNAAITLAMAGGAVIRNCDLKNAYIGLNVKDRNTGGVFGNPNPNDNDRTVPLSGFGMVGYHLIEHNRIHNNSLGFFFESAWDLSSTVRYNLIYRNGHTSDVIKEIVKQPEGPQDPTKPWEGNRPGGSLLFKDMVLTPIAIYNNTFYENSNELLAHWKTGATHLIFNNIFGKSNGDKPNDGMNTFKSYPNRMHNCVFAANEALVYESRHIQGCSGDGQNPTPNGQQISGITRVAIVNNFPQPGVGPTTVACVAPIADKTATASDFVPMGGILSGGTNPTIPASANLRWLEMTQRRTLNQQVEGSNIPTTYNLFESTDPANAKFLWPKWSDTLVIKYIKNKGWAEAGIRNADGEIADIGAISSAGNNNTPLRTIARIKASNVILISNGKADAEFFLNVDAGSFTNPKIKMLRWVAPLPYDTSSPPDITNNFGGSNAALPASAIRNIEIPANISLNVNGTNAVTFTLPSNTIPKYGFIEMVIEGTDASGKTVSSDIAFIPYRELKHVLEVCVQRDGSSSWDCGTGANPPSIPAGEDVKLRVTAKERNNDGTLKDYDSPPSGRELVAKYRLLSHSTARMWTGRTSSGNPRSPLDSTENLVSGSKRTETYTVFFTRAGSESISAAGQHKLSNGSVLPLLGTLRLNITPGAPDKVVFINPIPKSEVGTVPPTISGTYNVVVEVQDRYDNRVASEVEVLLKSLDPNKGDVNAPSTVKTDKADGSARFVVRVTNGKLGETFDIEASIDDSKASQPRDVAILRIGRAADELKVLYSSEAGNGEGDWYEDDDVAWPEDVLTGDRRQVWVKLVSNAGDTVITSKDPLSVCVTPSRPLKFFASADGTGSEEEQYLINLVNGVATFWITSDTPVEDVQLNASAKTTADCDGVQDNSINPGGKGGVAFRASSGKARLAVVSSNNGKAQPNYVRIEFTGDAGSSFPNAGGVGSQTWNKPDSIKLFWPCTSGVSVTTSGNNIRVLDDGVTIEADFNAGSFPDAGFSAPIPIGNGALVKIFNAIENGTSRSPEVLVDSIGPVIAKRGDGEVCGLDYNDPVFYENYNHGNVRDTLRLMLSEDLTASLLEGNTILISEDETGTYSELTVTSATIQGNLYVLELSMGDSLWDGAWIKLNHASAPAIVDADGNGPLSNNRPVQIRKTERPPEIDKAWYITDDATGKADKAYIQFKKVVSDKDDWFQGGNFKFNWSNIVDQTYNLTSTDVIRIVTGDGDELNRIEIDLKTAFDSASAAEPRGVILTGGIIEIDMKYAAAKNWPNDRAYAADHARPVLISAELQRGTVTSDGAEMPDTLIILYSELMNSTISTIKRPVSICEGGSDNCFDVELDIIGAPTPSGNYQRVTYKVPSGRLPAVSGDFVKIYEFAQVTDNATPSNTQDQANNRKVPLKIKAAAINWQTKIMKNPFRDSTRVVMTPRLGGGESRKSKAKIKLYDSMGKIVAERDNLENEPNGSDIVWMWDGRNKNGRIVGTGTYLFKATCIPEATAEDEHPRAYSTQGKIAFVRSNK